MALGWRGRGGGWSGPWPGRGPFSYLPPWQRPGWLFGFGRGFGRGLRWVANPYVCARFPWLPRGWWAYSQYGYGLPTPFTAYSWGYWLPWNYYVIPAYTYPYGYPPMPYMRYW